MSNRLKMATVHAIHLLHSLHWSQRRIARELGIDRGTVRRHLLAGRGRFKCRHSARRVRRSKCSHFNRSHRVLNADRPMVTGHAENAAGSNAAIPPPGSTTSPMAARPAKSARPTERMRTVPRDHRRPS